MPRLTALERPSLITIHNLAVPEVTHKALGYFEQEVEKLRPKLEEVLDESRKSSDFWKVASLWSFTFLFGSVEMSERDIHSVKAVVDDVALAANHNLDYWYYAMAKLVMGQHLTPQNMRDIYYHLEQFLMDVQDLGPRAHLHNDYVQALAAGELLFPDTLVFRLRANEQLREFIKEEIKESFTYNQIGDGVSYARALRILFQDEPDPLNSVWDQRVIVRAESLLPRKDISPMQALYQLAQRKLSMAHKVIINKEKIEFFFDEREAGEIENELHPPLQRSF